MRTLRKSVVSSRRTALERPAESPRFTATQAKNEFGRVLELALRGDAVIITKHDAPKAILISVEQFNKLAQSPERELDTLDSEFDDLLASMQSPKARAAMKALFTASPGELGKAAVAEARKRG
jgi:prevent-host-death family protein